MSPDSEPASLGGELEAAFCAEARLYGLDPANRWIGGYVNYEWGHARHYIINYLGPVKGLRVLELGCNVGATAIVLARLGADVYAVEVAAKWLALAKRNAERFGEHATLIQVGGNDDFPFADQVFDSVICNSVLEYIENERRAEIVREIDRVLKPAGTLLVLGTSNRLWPREVHSRCWLSNYVPVSLDRFLGSRRRGILPWEVTRRLTSYRDLVIADGGRGLFDAQCKQGASASKRLALRGLVAFARGIKQPAGAFMPSFLLALRKP